MASTDELRRELGDERIELAEAVATLRGKLDTAKRLGSKLPLVAAGAVGLGAAARLLLSRKR
jgi:hypothetical protein